VRGLKGENWFGRRKRAWIRKERRGRLVQNGETGFRAKTERMGLEGCQRFGRRGGSVGLEGKKG